MELIKNVLLFIGRILLKILVVAILIAIIIGITYLLYKLFN